MQMIRQFFLLLILIEFNKLVNEILGFILKNDYFQLILF